MTRVPCCALAAGLTGLIASDGDGQRRVDGGSSERVGAGTDGESSLAHAGGGGVEDDGEGGGLLRLEILSGGQGDEREASSLYGDGRDGEDARKVSLRRVTMTRGANLPRTTLPKSSVVSGTRVGPLSGEAGEAGGNGGGEQDGDAVGMKGGTVAAGSGGAESDGEIDRALRRHADGDGRGGKGADPAPATDRLTRVAGAAERLRSRTRAATYSPEETLPRS